jgi:signal transduction histidine kinase/CheY-like chemotaxis protein
MSVFSWKSGDHAAQIAEIAASAEFALLVDEKGYVIDSSVSANALLGDTLAREQRCPVWLLTQEPEVEICAFLEKCWDAREPLRQKFHFRDSEGGFDPRVCMGSPLAGREVLLICRPLHRTEGIGERIQAKLMALTAEVEERTRIESEARFDSEAKSRFLAAASHDLRQPLHAMTLFTRALSRRVEGEEAVELVNQLGIALGSLQRMFDSILDVSKLDGGLIKPQWGDVDLVEFFEPLGAELEARAASLGLSGRLYPLDGTVYTDRALLERIVRNLINNALKFTARGGIMLAARRRGDRVAIEIFDTGIGMSQAQLREVFNEFERGRVAARGQNDGLGLGLSIVRRLTQLLDIEISVDSRPGRGTRFRLLLPPGKRSSAHMRQSARETPVFANPDLKGRTMIVLDDEPMVVESLTRELRDHGIATVGVGSGAALRSMAAGVPVDAAIIDYDLGEERGPDVIAAFCKETGASFPMLIVTGSTEPEVLKHLQKLGHPWVTKPVNPDVLLALVASMLRRA